MYYSQLLNVQCVFLFNSVWFQKILFKMHPQIFNCKHSSVFHYKFTIMKFRLYLISGSIEFFCGPVQLHWSRVGHQICNEIWNKKSSPAVHLDMARELKRWTMTSLVSLDVRLAGWRLEIMEWFTNVHVIHIFLFFVD